MEIESCLTDQAILAKINQLRELNVGSIIPLPQLVVVGDQSSGKSSVLESLTGFSFPHAAGLCTRYATHITTLCESQKSIFISIIPHPDADEALRSRLLKFQRHLTEIDNNELVPITLISISNLGLVLGQQGKYEEAEDMHRLYNSMSKPENTIQINKMKHFKSTSNCPQQ